MTDDPGGFNYKQLQSNVVFRWAYRPGSTLFVVWNQGRQGSGPVAGENAVKEVTMAKLVTQRAAFDVMDTCLQLHGGAGYMREYEIERMARDARLGPIGGGTDEIMREILSKVLGI